MTEGEIWEAGISSLSNRPTSSYAYGGEGLTPAAMKARFDRLPRMIADRVNALIAMLLATPSLSDPSGESIAEMIKSGLQPEKNEGHTLADFFRELVDGSIGAYLKVGDEPLHDVLASKEQGTRIEHGEGSGELLLKSGREVRIGELDDLCITLPSEPSPDYAAMLVFDTKGENGASRLTLPSEIVWSGDDVVDGAFGPLGGRHYTLMLWYDGRYQGIVRSVKR